MQLTNVRMVFVNYEAVFKCMHQIASQAYDLPSRENQPRLKSTVIFGGSFIQMAAEHFPFIISFIEGVVFLP